MMLRLSAAVASNPLRLRASSLPHRGLLRTRALSSAATVPSNPHPPCLPGALPGKRSFSVAAHRPVTVATTSGAWPWTKPGAPAAVAGPKPYPKSVVLNVGGYRWHSTSAAAAAAASGSSNAAGATASEPTFSSARVPLAKRVLVIGSGGLSIGQAGEFDYSGSQAIKALKDEGVHTILINPNIATVQTDRNLADSVYFLPVTPEYVEEVIAKERPDGILLTFGGQTALNVGIALDKSGVLAKYKIKVLGTQISTLERSEDRDLFAKALQEIDIPIATSVAVETVDEALAAAKDIGYPVIVRSAFALGGLGSGFANDADELHALATQSLTLSPQILVERSMKGWKEVEYEVVRDAEDNCITVCNMENLDPLGVHTGDSVVVAPSQTLSDQEYHMLRTAAIRIIRHLGVVGECNVQYALNPDTLEYAVIEVNARLSRSSALASKATGYPLALVAAKIALGYSLPDLRNGVTKTTTACFEPSLDYVVTKIPRWDLAKFAHVGRSVGSQMKSVGEVMAIGRTFEESLQKAMRMVDPSIDGFAPQAAPAAESLEAAKSRLTALLAKPSDTRMFHLSEALHRGTHTVDELFEITKVDRWFLYKLANIATAHRALSTHADLSTLDATTVRTAKQLGFSDKQIAGALTSQPSELAVRAHRTQLGVTPWIKRIDTVAGEFPADTNYLYMTYHGSAHDVTFDAHGTMVLGSGVYRIGSSVEFDWCGVSAIRTLRGMGKKTVMVNYNPETVSTDYDEADRLYFEELSLERVLDIYQAEAATGVVVSVGGQLAQNIALPLSAAGCAVLGTSPKMIDAAEDRHQFSQVLDAAGVAQPQWQQLTTPAEAVAFAERVGYPVLVRPSYVLSGAAMRVARNAGELTEYLSLAASVSPKHPVVVTQFIEGAHEIDVDGVAYQGALIADAVSLHVENAGVHSGDASLILPAVELDQPSASQPATTTRQRVRAVAAAVAKALQISGPFNMQVIHDPRTDALLVIECNLRASRSFPFSSKVFGTNLIEVATRAMVGEAVPAAADLQAQIPAGVVATKVPQFSWTRLAGADPMLSVEMASTGEVACFGKTATEAFLTSLEAVNGWRIPRRTVFVDHASDTAVKEAETVAAAFAQLGHPILTTSASVAAAVTKAAKSARVTVLTGDSDVFATAAAGATIETVRTAAKAVLGEVDLVVHLSSTKAEGVHNKDYAVRRVAVDLGVPLVTDVPSAHMLTRALAERKAAGRVRGEVQPWDKWVADKQ
ncbi:carbamoyl-phosphate synthase (glutamine-hydrolyzing) cpa2 [Blastocladiella emersonii ATCC 22665]|nr:carbamoyl-phosphate synthase (glutamine-hydrolyzing) cpa2 [Blastocladiella emersonii ATCC 22665]